MLYTVLEGERFGVICGCIKYAFFLIFKGIIQHLQQYQLVWLPVFLVLWGPITFQNPPSHLLPCHMPIITVHFPLEIDWILPTSLLLHSPMDQSLLSPLECMLQSTTAGASGAHRCTHGMILLGAILYLPWMWCTHLSIRHRYGRGTTLWMGITLWLVNLQMSRGLCLYQG